MDEIISLCKRRGFVYPSSEIYGGFSATYDYGPLGALMLRNLQDIWLKTFIYSEENIYLMDGAIISHPKTWEASGHVQAFNDPLVEDKITHKRYRADKLIEENLHIDTKDITFEGMQKLIKERNLKSSEGHELTEVKRFNLLVEALIGSVEGEKNKAYLRGETCQNIFLQYQNLLDTLHPIVPFGVGQIGKAFRNEITTKQFILRTREFYQMETEYFISPEDKRAFDDWRDRLTHFFLDVLGLDKNRLRFREIEGQEKSHYAKQQNDVEYQLTSGQWLELTPLNHRGSWDLSRHSQYSGHSLTYKDNETGKEFIPQVIETSIGLDRLFYTMLDSSLLHEEKRIVLKLNPNIAPYKAAIFPLVKNKENIVRVANEIYTKLKKSIYPVIFDDNDNIGKRYRRQDEIGTPFCITIDYQTLEDNSVTVRDRDSMSQERIKEKNLVTFLKNKFPVY